MEGFHEKNHLVGWHECVKYSRELRLAALVVKMVLSIAELTVFIVKKFFECELCYGRREITEVCNIWAGL